MNLHTFQMPKHNMTLLIWTKPDHSIVGLNYIPEMLDVEQYPIEAGFTINQELTDFVSMTEGDGDYYWSIWQSELDDFLDTVCHRIKQFCMVDEADDVKYDMNYLTRVIIPCFGFDRYIVLFLDDKNKIVGMSFWQGFGDFDNIELYLKEPTPGLWKFAAKPYLANGHPVYYSISFDDWALDCLNYSIDKFINIKYQD